MPCEGRDAQWCANERGVLLTLKLLAMSGSALRGRGSAIPRDLLRPPSKFELGHAQGQARSGI